MSRREEVLDVAERLLERAGPQALTMRTLADELGIRAPSLYKHVAGKEDIEAALQERALRSIAAALAGVEPALAGFAAAYRAWALAHPRLYELATRRPPARDRIGDGVEDGAAAPLVRLVGGDRARARAVWAMTHGLVDLELAGRFPAGADVAAAWAAGIDAFAAVVEGAEDDASCGGEWPPSRTVRPGPAGRRIGSGAPGTEEDSIMPTNAENAYALFEAAVGQPEGSGEWFEVTQERIDQFAEVTEDRQFIHVDPKLAAELSPWGTTIAHGFLTLSLLTHLMGSVPQPHERAIGVVMGVNYGFEKVRFVNPVKVGSKVRATSVLKSVELKDPNTLNITRTVTIEIDGETKPAVVADWVTRLVYG